MIVKYIERCKHMLQLVTLDILKVEGEICLLVFFFFFKCFFKFGYFLFLWFRITIV